ncbi:hypothetical protein [Aureivirga sp. CE67]|uniref:hypothetical protein n=1 Tax=Aureivirga sp. CE67 TaxID=1788983 RepID=UPI0018CBCE78|nr:hypothetical protein [Aureivirga sp. CE67]
MNNLNSDKKIIFPPGNNIESIVPSTSGEISFQNNFKAPFPTVANASFDEETNEMSISILFFINSTVENPEIKINQHFSIGTYGECNLQFFLYSNEDETKRIIDSKTEDGVYNAFTLNFKTSNTENFPENINLSDIKTIQTYLWNVDPRTSRGTVTIVETTK